MPRRYGRNQRVADQVRRELAPLIQREDEFRKTGLITISFVDVSSDLKNARVYFTCLDSALSEEALAGLLNEKAGHFRHQLARSLPLRVAPRLAFFFDHSIGRASRLVHLIEVANRRTEQ